MRDEAIEERDDDNDGGDDDDDGECRTENEDVDDEMMSRRMTRAVVTGTVLVLPLVMTPTVIFVIVLGYFSL